MNKLLIVSTLMILICFLPMLIRYFRQATCLGLSIILLVPEYLATRVGSLPEINATRLILLFLFLLLVIKIGFFGRQNQAKYGRLEKRIWIVLVLFVAVRILSALFSDTNTASIFASFYDVMIFIGIPLILVNALKSMKDINAIIHSIIISVLVLALYGLYEGYTQNNPIRNIIPESSSREFAHIVKYRDNIYRIQSLSLHPIGLAEILVFTLPLLFYRIRNTKVIFRLLYSFGVTIILIANDLTESRAGYAIAVGFVLVQSIKFAKGNIRKNVFKSWLIASVIVIGLVGYSGKFISPIIDGIIGTRTSWASSNNIRMLQLAQGISGVLAEPAFGYGPQKAEEIVGLAAIDNFYLSVILESGIIGLLCYLAIIGFFIAQIVRLKKLAIARNLIAYTLIQAIQWSLIIIVVFSLISSLRYNSLLLSILIGLTISLERYLSYGASENINAVKFNNES